LTQRNSSKKSRRLLQYETKNGGRQRWNQVYDPERGGQMDN
jgi:hypothetical protein